MFQMGFTRLLGVGGDYLSVPGQDARVSAVIPRRFSVRCEFPQCALAIFGGCAMPVGAIPYRLAAFRWRVGLDAAPRADSLQLREGQLRTGLGGKLPRPSSSKGRREDAGVRPAAKP